ncbi:MAG TPA: transcriptional regulator TrmB, partial [Micromonosporaceae bacterium]
MLGALGLEPADEAIYRLLVTNAGLTMADLAGLTDRTSGDLDGVLSRLVAQGLVARTPAIETPGVVPQFRAAPPAVALGGLLRQRRDDLHAAEQDLATLVEEHRLATAGASTSGVVEEITDITAVRQRFSQIQEAAQFEVLSMVIPNLTVVPHRQNASGNSGVRRGVRYRAILDRAALTVPGMLADVVASIECGQEIRIADHVAVKMMIVDRQCAMLPLLHAQHT